MATSVDTPPAGSTVFLPGITIVHLLDACFRWAMTFPKVGCMSFGSTMGQAIASTARTASRYAVVGSGWRPYISAYARCRWSPALPPATVAALWTAASVCSPARRSSRRLGHNDGQYRPSQRSLHDAVPLNSRPSLPSGDGLAACRYEPSTIPGQVITAATVPGPVLRCPQPQHEVTCRVQVRQQDRVDHPLVRVQPRGPRRRLLARLRPRRGQRLDNRPASHAVLALDRAGGPRAGLPVDRGVELDTCAGRPRSPRCAPTSPAR